MASGPRLEERLKNLYRRLYETVCGKHPHLRPWHFEWLPTRDLYADLRRILSTLEGSVLDVGCGEKPYQAWTPKAKHYVGVDVYAGPGVDVVVRPYEPWPLDGNSFDHVLCTQVLEHVVDLENTLGEIRRVLKPGGQLIVAIPFIFQEHGVPNDYRRFSLYGAQQMLAPHYDLRELKLQGGIGTALGLLGLNWIDYTMRQRTLTRIVFAAGLPLWIVFCGLVNSFGFLLDKVDRTQAFYTNLLVVARKTTPQERNRPAR